MRYEIPISLRKHVVRTDVPTARADALAQHGVDVDPDSDGYDPCWSWTGSTNNAGYGQKKRNGKNWNTHRLAWHILVEKLPQPGSVRKAKGGLGGDGLILDHVCENRLCCNPSHIERISQSDNVKRGARHRG